jgi:hypothetical protein
MQDLTRQMVRAAAVGALVIAWSARPASADGKYDLKHDEKVGHRYEFDSTSEMTQKFVVTPQGGKADTDEQHKIGRRKGTIEVLEVRAGSPAALKIHFDEEASTDSLEQNTNKKSVSFALAGKTVIVRIDEKGKTTSDAPAGIDSDAIHEVIEEILPSRAMLPTHPVAIGDEWQPDLTDLARQYELGPKDTIEARCKFETVDAAGRLKTARIHFTGHVTKEVNGMPSTLDVQGIKQIDLITGDLLHNDVAGKMTVKGTTNGPGPDGKPTTATVDGFISFHEVEDHTPVAIADAGAPVALAPVTGVQAFAGIFRSDELTVELAPTTNGQLRGFITLSDKKLPAMAEIKEEKLIGVFETEGTKFNFTATLDGKTMTLVSDGTSYVLKKRVNPLDRSAAPAPKNPLAR